MLPPSRYTILAVDDAPDTLEVLHRNLTSQGYRVFTAQDVPMAVQFLEQRPIDLVITDLKMPKISGLDLVRHIQANLRETEVIMITGYPTIEGAVQAVKNGAEEYLAKPFTEEELASAVRRGLEKLELRKLGQAASFRMPSSPHGIMGTSPVMRELFHLVDQVAPTPATVLITGESGTGKELVARAIHYTGPRASAPFVPVNCGGVPEGLLESALFGHVKGAFTGATESRAGFFHSADGGTLFLDEIGETSLAMQIKLLRVLQDKEICMVGSTRARKIDVRILAATNKDLSALVKKGGFREDLYYRLNVIVIAIPPLRERGEDILLMTRLFAARFAEEFGKPVPRFSEEVLQVFQHYAWPGNVRELENVIQRLVLTMEGKTIEIPDLPALMRFSVPAHSGFRRPLAEVEAEYIHNVLADVKGNISQAAKILGIDRKTLREKIAKTSAKSV
ncbi:MAG: sigma-54-dependent transcriptional regulator [bacterium]